MTDPHDLRVLRQKAVTAITGLGETRIRELEKDGKFPKRIKISERACGWLAHEIQAYIAGRVALSREGGCNKAPDLAGDRRGAAHV